MEISKAHAIRGIGKRHRRCLLQPFNLISPTYTHLQQHKGRIFRELSCYVIGVQQKKMPFYHLDPMIDHSYTSVKYHQERGVHVVSQCKSHYIKERL